MHRLERARAIVQRARNLYKHTKSDNFNEPTFLDQTYSGTDSRHPATICYYTGWTITVSTDKKLFMCSYFRPVSVTGDTQI